MESAEAQVDQDAQPLYCSPSFAQLLLPLNSQKSKQSRRPPGHQVQSALLQSAQVHLSYQGQQRRGPGLG